jgi:hypothetical protein
MCQGNVEYIGPRPVLNAKGAIVIHDPDEPVSFETQVKPLFRERDRQSMLSVFDLWSHDDVSRHADAILARLRDGTMPCDGAWPPAQVELFQRWAEGGKTG